MDVFDLFAKITLDVTQYDKNLDGAKSKLAAFGGFMAKGFGAVAATGAAAVTAATGAVAALAKQSVDAATSFESAFTGVKKTVDATAEEYDQLADWIMEASTKMASSKEDIAGTMEIAGQLGVEGVEALEAFTETMIMLGDTTNLSSEEAASALARFMNITGDSAENVGAIGSAIVDLGNHFATTESDIVEMSTRLASAGTIAGLSATDILALATSMSSVGIQAEAGGTAMTQTLANITRAVDGGVQFIGQNIAELDKDSANALAQLEEYARISGMTAQDFADTWKGEPIEAVTAFIKGLGKLNESDESVIATLDRLGLKGVRQTNMLQSLALASDVLTKAVDTSNQAYKEAIENTDDLNALQAEAEKRYGTTESAAMQTAESFKNLKVVIGQELLPAYSEMMSFTQGAMESLATGMKEGGVTGLMAAVGDALAAALNGIIEKLPDFINAGISLLSALGEGLGQNVDAILTAIDGVLTTIFDTISNGAEKEGDSAIGKFIKGLASIFVNHLGDIVQIGMNIITSILDGIAQNSKDIAQGAVTIISTLAEGLGKALPDIIPAVVEIILAIVDGLLDNADKLLDAAYAIIEGLIGGLARALPKLLEYAPQIIAEMVGALVQAIPRIIGLGFELIVGLVAGLIQGIPKLFEGLAEVVNAILDTIKEFFGIHSPSTVFAEIGMFLIEGLIQGITDMIGGVIEVIGELGASVIESITGFFSDAWSKAKELASDAWNAIKDTATEAWGKIEEGAGKLRDNIGAFFDTAKTNAVNAWNDAKSKFATVWSNVQGAFANVGSWFQSTFTTAKNWAVGAWSDIKLKFTTVWGNVKSAFSNAGEWFKTNFTTFKDNAVSAWSDIKDKFGKVWGNLKDAFHLDDALTWGKDLVSNFIGGIKAKAADLKEELKGVADKVKAFLGFSEPEEGPLSDFHTYAPDMMELFAKGIRDNTDIVTDQIKKSFDFGNMITAEGAMSTGGFNAGGVTINVYARDGQSARSIVDEIDYRIAKKTEAKKAVWGMS